MKNYMAGQIRDLVREHCPKGTDILFYYNKLNDGQIEQMKCAVGRPCRLSTMAEAALLEKLRKLGCTYVKIQRGGRSETARNSEFVIIVHWRLDVDYKEG